MASSLNIIGIALLILSIALTWLGPRHFGAAGLIVVHLFVLLAYFVFAYLVIDAGRYKYDGILSMIGLVIQAFLTNCLLLPIGIAALWRRRRVARRRAIQYL